MIQPKIPEISVGTIQMESTSPEGDPLWPVWSFRSVWPVWPKCFVDSQLLFPVLLFCILPRSGLDRVCSTLIYRSIDLSRWNFRNFKPEFLLNGNRPSFRLSPLNDREETSKLLNNFYFFTSLKSICASQRGLDVQFIDQFSEFSLILAEFSKNKVITRTVEFPDVNLNSAQH